MKGQKRPPPQASYSTGWIETGGLLKAPKGWLVSGTLPRPFDPDSTSRAVWTATIDGVQARWAVRVAFVDRPDTDQASIGFVAHVAEGTGRVERCTALSLELDDVAYEVEWAPQYRKLVQNECLVHAITLLTQHGLDNASTAALLALLLRVDESRK